VSDELAGPLVFDASAILALLFDEPGTSTVEQLLSASPGIVSAVNYCEVLTKVAQVGFDPARVELLFAAMPITIVDANTEMARCAAALGESTKYAGLSLGDRFCIACASYYKGTAITADKNWRNVVAAPPVLLIR